MGDIMSALDILKAVASASEGTIEGTLPPRTIRFALEYDSTPDLAVESDRIAAFLESRKFSLERLDADLPHFLVLQFPGVLRRISTPTLYAMAAELARGLNLVSCVPDVGVPVVVDPGQTGSVTESVVGDAILNFTCWAKEDDGLPKKWAVESIRADKAWVLTKGAGVIIAQPDTGVSLHPELELGALDLTKAKNILNNTNDPTDPLSDEAGNPGHGTATSSTAISRLLGQIAGSAPEARLVPIRCVDSVILGLDGTPLARAVLHAKRIGADVITMSLGGPFYSPSLAAAIQQAVDAGIIVCAAAGNCVQPIVVYPAWDSNVIALAGIDHNDKPWKGTSRGPKIDVAAPAENVFVARRTPFDGGVGTIKPSQGTSFSTALTAGVAALWIAHFGREAIRKEAQKNGVNVHHLFRAALRKTARPPKSGVWDTANFGTGIVDAEALLKLPLDKIPPAPPMPAAVATDNPEAAVSTVMIEAVSRRQADFDWKRHGAEAVYLATDAWRRASPSRDMLVESTRKPTPSPELVATAPAVLRTAMGQATDAPAMRPPVISEPARREFIRSLGARGMGGTESAAATTIEAARANLRGAGLDDLQRLVSDTFKKLDAQGDSVEGAAARRSVLESIGPVVRGLLGPQGEVALPVDHRATLEALVKMKGRPSFRVVSGTIDPHDPLFGEWGGSLIVLPELPTITGAVGRIDGDGSHVGTGFVIGDGVIMTNRHVLEAIAEEVRNSTGSKWVFSFGEVTIDFSENADGSARFRIKSLIATGPDPIEGLVRFPRLDMALLEVETVNAAGLKLPTPLRMIDARAELQQKGDMFTIGFPARPSTSSMIDPATGTFSVEVAKRLTEIFNVKYGKKYLSPGIVDQPTGVSGDLRNWVFTHDATTLGGNSGSAAIRLMDPLGVSGLHFGGATLTANYAHSIAAVKASGVLPAIAGAGITWL
jgi:serine protease